MKKFTLLFLPVLFANNLFSQATCNDDVIMAVNGKWKTSPDDIIGPDKTFPASQYNQLKTRLDKIAVLFQEAYPNPKGNEANWYRSIRGNAMVNNGPVPYQFTSLYLSWYCNPNLHKLMLGTETGTWAYIFINDLNKFLEKVADFKINANTAFFLPDKVGEWKGMSLYDVGSTTYKQDRAVLITRGSQLPYIPVTRLQYLIAIKQKLEDEKIIQIDLNNKMKIRTDAEQELDKQTGMENALKYAPASRVEERKANYLKNYKTDQQRKEENLQRLEKNYSVKLKAIDDLLKTFDNDELEKPAVIDPFHDFKQFSTLEKGGRMMVLLNNNYFNMQLPRYMPQLMVLRWRSESNNNAPSQFFKKQFEANFPIDKLKLMIDK
jgi:hypothetical protein